MTPPITAACGTYSAYKRHLTHRETPCQPCRDANNRERRERYKRVHVVKTKALIRLAEWDFRPAGWVQSAACASVDPELFFADQPEVQAQAVAVCLRCPVREPCLAEGIRTGSDGVWGGTLPRQRDRVRPSSERGSRADRASDA